MAINQDSPLDRAHTCVTKLQAIDDLLVQASAGSQDMHLVNPDHLCILLGGIIDELDTAIDELARISKPCLRTV